MFTSLVRENFASFIINKISLLSILINAMSSESIIFQCIVMLIFTSLPTIGWNYLAIENTVLKSNVY